jgi:hypothetical protein
VEARQRGVHVAAPPVDAVGPQPRFARSSRGLARPRARAARGTSAAAQLAAARLGCLRAEKLRLQPARAHLPIAPHRLRRTQREGNATPCPGFLARHLSPRCNRAATRTEVHLYTGGFSGRVGGEVGGTPGACARPLQCSARSRRRVLLCRREWLRPCPPMRSAPSVQTEVRRTSGRQPRRLRRAAARARAHPLGPQAWAGLCLWVVVVEHGARVGGVEGEAAFAARREGEAWGRRWAPAPRAASA